jgi:pentatricopeptide repeat protein
MIYSYGKCGKIDEASRLLREMTALNVSLSVVTYNSLLSCNPSVNYAEAVFHQVKVSKLSC